MVKQGAAIDPSSVARSFNGAEPFDAPTRVRRVKRTSVQTEADAMVQRDFDDDARHTASAEDVGTANLGPVDLTSMSIDDTDHGTMASALFSDSSDPSPSPDPSCGLSSDFSTDFGELESLESSYEMDGTGTRTGTGLEEGMNDPLIVTRKARGDLWSSTQKQKTVVWWYLQELSKHKLLSSQEEIELGRQIQEGNEKALLKLVAGNLRLVVSIAKRYMRQGMDFEDVIQEGNLGLMLAAKKFDPSMGNKFSTYATWWIRQSITRALSNKSRTIRLPVHVNEMLFKLRRAAKPFYQKMGRPPSIPELCQSTGLSHADVDHVLKSSLNTLSMDEYIAAGEDETLEKFIEDKGIPRPEDYAEMELLSRKVNGLMNALAQDERNVLTPLYGLDGKSRRSAKEVAASLGIEVRDVRRIEIRGLRRLRRATHNRKLCDYLADA